MDWLARWVPLGYLVRPQVLLAAPKVVQAVFAAAGDWFTWRLAVRVYGQDSNTAWSAVWPLCSPCSVGGLFANSSQLYMTMFNPWQWYCSTRTFSNSLETTLTVAALYYWPWELHASPKAEKENAKPRPALQANGAVKR